MRVYNCLCELPLACIVNIFAGLSVGYIHSISLVEPGVFGYLSYTLARINTRLLRTDNNTRHNICIVPRQLFVRSSGASASSIHESWLLLLQLRLGELTTLILLSEQLPLLPRCIYDFIWEPLLPCIWGFRITERGYRSVTSSGQPYRPNTQSSTSWECL